MIYLILYFVYIIGMIIVAFVYGVAESLQIVNLAYKSVILDISIVLFWPIFLIAVILYILLALAVLLTKILKYIEIVHLIKMERSK